MTIPRHTTLFFALAAAGVLLQGCDAAKQTGPSARLYEVDFKGAAKTCEAPKQKPAAGKTTEATLKVGSDGGWCGATVSNDGKPFAAGLLTARPAHGKVLVHSVGNDTRIDYTPEFGFVGADSFSVELLPGSAILHVAVTAIK
ncbi:MAG: hypothetical protein WCI94_20740 [Rhodospirillales bacterium]